MPESFIPVWMSVGEAEEFRRFLQEEARSTDGEFPEREFDLIDSALTNERPRTFEELERERADQQQHSTEEGGEARWQVGQRLRHPIGSEWELVERNGGAGDDWRAKCVRAQLNGSEFGQVRTFHREYMDRTFKVVAPSSTEEGRG